MTTTQNRRPKFSLQKATMDFTSKIAHIANSVSCEKHSASAGWACWYLTSDDGTIRNAICGRRASKMYTGQVSDSSFDRRKSASRNPKKEINR